jgi:hypothetical protein
VRSVALVTLFAIVANPYVSFYDGFVLVVPATLWIANRDEYPGLAWGIIGGLIATYWLWDMGIFYYKYAVPVFAEPRVSAAGIILTAWLLTEARARPLSVQLESLADRSADELQRAGAGTANSHEASVSRAGRDRNMHLTRYAAI